MALFQSIIEIQSLANDVYKFLHGPSPAIMSNIIKFDRPPTCNLRNHEELYNRNLKTVRYGSKETISYNKYQDNQFL